MNEYADRFTLADLVREELEKRERPTLTQTEWQNAGLASRGRRLFEKQVSPSAGAVGGAVGEHLQPVGERGRTASDFPLWPPWESREIHDERPSGCLHGAWRQHGGAGPERGISGVPKSAGHGRWPPASHPGGEAGTPRW